MEATEPTTEFTDRLIQCVDCPEVFLWTAGEQRYFQSKGLQQPKRCKPCRREKRERAGDGYCGGVR